MLRLRQLYRNPLLSFRLDPPRPRYPEVRNVRSVKFRRPWVRKLISTSLLWGVAFHLWSSVVLLQLDDRDDDDESPESTQRRPSANNSGNRGDKTHVNNAHQTEEPEEEDDDSVFIPLGWPRYRKGEFYAASDPEWQQFSKISRDSEKLQSLRDELAAIVLKNVQASPILHALGGPLSVSGFWLVSRYPYRAPPSYERSGLAIRDTSISWITKPIPPEDGDRLLRVMKPFSIAFAIWDAYKVFLRRKLNRLRGSGNSDDRLSGASEMLPNVTAMPQEQKKVDGLSHIAQPNSRRPGLSELQEDVSEEQDDRQSLVISSLQRLPSLELGPGSDLQEALTVFKRRLKIAWSKHPHTPRRGVFYIAGPVGINGSAGFCRVEVQGEYDPAAARWRAVTMRLKDINAAKQNPLGGR